MIDKVVNLMPDTGDDSNDEGLEDKDSGIMVKFQAVDTVHHCTPNGS